MYVLQKVALLHARRGPLLNNRVQLRRKSPLDLLGGLVCRRRESAHGDVSPSKDDLVHRRVAVVQLLATVEEGAGLLEDDGRRLELDSAAFYTYADVPSPAARIVRNVDLASRDVDEVAGGRARGWKLVQSH